MQDPVPSVTTVAEQVRADRVRLLFRQSLLATPGSYAAAVILSWLYWGLGDHDAIATWLGILGIASLARLAVFALYYGKPDAQRTPRYWERIYGATLAITAAVWGLGALWVMPRDDLLSQTIGLFFAVGMAGSAISMYSAFSSMALTAIGLVLLPTAMWVLVQPTLAQRGMALAALLFAASVARATHGISAALETAMRLTHELKLAHSVATQAAMTDELTGLKNRRAFFERAEQQFSYCRRQQQPVCLVVLDIDLFKQINDSHGHLVGDEVLRRVGALLQTTFRESDVCGRIGGEEFAIMLPEAGAEDGDRIAQEVRVAIAALNVRDVAGNRLPLSASLGVACARGDEKLLDALNRADKAMYFAKAHGRNRVEVMT